MDKILSACFLEWSAGRSEPILGDDVVYFMRFPEQYPVVCPDQKQTEYADILDRGWDTVKKQSKEMGKYDYVFPGCGVLRVFLGWREFLTSFHAGGSFCSQLHVLQVRASFLGSSKPTINSGDSSHYRQFARAIYTGACSIHASLSTLGGTSL